MFSFLFGLGAGAICVLNRDATRRLIATILVKGQDAAQATAREAIRWSARVGEEFQDIMAEARAEEEHQR
jgi:hypothetical protein